MPLSILSEIEEQNLVRWICHLGSRGFPVTICHFLDRVQILLKSQKKPNPFANDRPGRHWLDAFQRRHPESVSKLNQKSGVCFRNEYTSVVSRDHRVL